MNHASTMNTLSSEDFNMKKPEEVIKPEFLETYKALHSNIWRRLILVHTNIIILERIEKFPFQHFYAPHENIFWTMVYWNYLYLSILFIYGLVDDTGPDTNTIPQLKRKLWKEGWFKVEHEEYRQALKKADLHRDVKKIREKLELMRNKVVAHQLLRSVTNIKVPGVSLLEIRKVYDETEKLFRMFSFGSDYLTTFYIPGVVGGKPIVKDIDELFDLIVKNSYWLNQPERRAPFWDIQKRYKSPEDIEELNKWRAKFGLPPA